MLTQLTAKECAVAAHQAREDFYFYCRYMMFRRRGIKWMRAKHHTRVCEALMRVFRGECKRLLINMPPRSSKTELVTDFIEYGLGHFPDSEFMYLSYSAELAVEKTGDALNDVMHPAYHEIFPDVELTHTAAGHWKTSKGGVVYAAGVTGTVIGKGAGKMRPGFGGALIFDDPHKASEVFTEVRQKVIDNFQSSVETRLNWQTTPIIVIAHCLHEEDLIAWLAEGGNGETWERIRIPAINEDGTALWPEKQPIEDLLRLQKKSPYVFASQYMQRPTPLGGAFFSKEQLLVEGLPVSMPTVLDAVYAVIDTANKAGSEHDGLAVVFFGIRPGDVDEAPVAILDWDITQIEGALLKVWIPHVFARLEELARECHALQGSLGVWIEDKGSGTILLQQCEAEGWPAQPIDNILTALGKAPRAINVGMAYVHPGKCKFTEHAYNKMVKYKGAEKNHLLVQILRFSASTGDQGADDLLDCWSYGLAIGLGNPEGV